MTTGNQASRNRKATNITIESALLAEAKELHINLSQAAEAGVAKAVADVRAKLWLAENKEALDDWNRYVEENGLPLEKYRSF